MAVKKSTDDKGKKADMPFAEGIVESKEPNVLGTFTPDQLDVLKDLQEQLAELKANQVAVSSAMQGEGGYDNIMDDYLEDPVVFFAFSSWFGIYSDKRYGRESLPPREEPIVFTKLYRYSKKTSGHRGNDVISVSQCVVRSKEAVEWLRTHSLFGIKFFENIAKAQNVNVTLAEKMSEMNSVVSTLNDHQVIERSRREQIPVTDGDITNLRKVLVRKLAEDALKNEKHVHEMKFKGTEIDEDGRKVEYRKANDIDADLQTTSAY